MIARRPRRSLRWWQALWAIVVVAFAVPGASRAGAADAIVLVGAHAAAGEHAARAVPSSAATCASRAGAACRAVGSFVRPVAEPPLAFATRAAIASWIHAPAPPDRIYLRTSRLLR